MQKPATTAPARIAPSILTPHRAPASDDQLRMRSGIIKKRFPRQNPRETRASREDATARLRKTFWPVEPCLSRTRFIRLMHRTIGQTLLLQNGQLAYPQVFHIKLIDLEMAQMNSFHEQLPNNQTPDHEEADS